MVSDTIKVQVEVTIEDVDFIEIPNDVGIYVVYNSTGPICYCNSKEEASKYSLTMKRSKSPVQYKKINRK